MEPYFSFKDIPQNQDLALVQEGNIYYIVMNQLNNRFTLEWDKQFNSILDKIESTTGPGVLVTVSTSPKIFHTGFHLDVWKNNPIEQFEIFHATCATWARLLQFPLPTLAVISGHAYAGGIFLALAHDQRIMQCDGKGVICLSELNIDLPIPQALIGFLQSTLPSQTVRDIIYGGKFNSHQGLEYKLLTGLYKDEEDKKAHIFKFQAQFAEKGAFRETLGEIKYSLHKRIIDSLKNASLNRRLVQKITRF